MTNDIEFGEFSGGGEHAHVSGGEADLTRLTDVSVELAVEVGRTFMSLGEAMALGPGSVITLDRLADKPVDLLINGRPIARGEVVVIDEQFGLRVTEVVGGVREREPAAEIVALDAAPEMAIAPPPVAEPEVADADIAAIFDQGPGSSADAA